MGAPSPPLTEYFELARLTGRDLVGRLQSPAARPCPAGRRAAVSLRRRSGVPRHGAARWWATAASDVSAAYRHRAVRIHRPVAQAERPPPGRALRDALVSPRRQRGCLLSEWGRQPRLACPAPGPAGTAIRRRAFRLPPPAGGGAAPLRIPTASGDAHADHRPRRSRTTAHDLAGKLTAAELRRRGTSPSGMYRARKRRNVS